MLECSCGTHSFEGEMLSYYAYMLKKALLHLAGIFISDEFLPTSKIHSLSYTNTRNGLLLW